MYAYTVLAKQQIEKENEALVMFSRHLIHKKFNCPAAYHEKPSVCDPGNNMKVASTYIV